MNELADIVDSPVIECRVYLPNKPGHMEYTRIVVDEAIETTSMLAFYKDDLWFHVEQILMEYANDKQRKGPKEGPIKRLVRRLRG